MRFFALYVSRIVSDEHMKSVPLELLEVSSMLVGSA